MTNLTLLKLKNRKVQSASYFSKNLQKLMLLMIVFSITCLSLNAQNTPPNANSDADCGADCWDLFSWSTVEDGSGNNIPNFAEGLASDANCNTTIDATAEYTGADSNGPDLVGTAIGANSQGTSTDLWEVSFGTALTDPVINFSALETTSNVLITDCNGNEITATCISSCGANLAFTSGVGWNGDVSYSLQLSGTYDCINISVAVINNDAYTFSIGTCLGAAPFPPCVNCGTNEDFKYLTLTNRTGTGTGATADVELNGVLYGTAEVLYSDLSINEDLSGSAFGAFAQDNETLVLEIELCEEITVQQLDVLGLETESQVWIGNTLNGSGATAIPEGITLTQCGGGSTMSPTGNMVTNTAASCSNQGNGNYTIDGGLATSLLYFRYTNPSGGCVFDKATFRIGTCVPDGADAVPVCPLTYVTYATDIEDYVTNGPDFTGNDANAFQVMRDANGNFFNQDCGQIENEVNNGTSIPTVAISPCAEVVDEEDCSFCDPAPPCITCVPNSTYEYIDLRNYDDNTMMGDIFLNDVLVGTSSVVLNTLTISEDLSGTRFGAFANGNAVTEELIIQLDFCEPLNIQQVDILGLETNSQVFLGTALSGSTLSGLTIDDCGSNTDAGMMVDGTTNTVTNMASSCANQGDGNYLLSTPSVSTLYFRYVNEAGSCRYDKTTYRIGVCVPELVDAIPVCPLTEVTYATDIEDYVTNGPDFNGNDANAFIVTRDANGNFFDQNCTQIQNEVENMTAIPTVPVSPCAEVVDEVDCSYCDPAPPCTTCAADNSYQYIDLRNYDDNTMMGDIFLNDVLVGTSSVVANTLTVGEDLNGTRFGAFANGNTVTEELIIQLDFCEPLNIQQVDILGLETNSQVFLGTALSGSTLSGLTIDDCGSNTDVGMMVDGSTNSVTNMAASCANQGDGNYLLSTPSVSTLYFRYVNEAGSCRYDKTTYRIGVCVPNPVMAAPTCPLELFTIDDYPSDPSNSTTDYYRDVNGNWFPANICVDPIDEVTLVEAVEISACATMTFVEECEFCCMVEIFCPSAGIFDCEDEAGIDAWLASYTTEMCDETGLTVSTDYDRDDFDKCVTTTNSITFSISDATGVLSSCSADLTINAAAPAVLTTPTLPTTLSCVMADGYVAPDATFTNNLAGVCENSGNITSTMAYSFDACGGTMTVNYSGLDDCGNTLSAGPFTINVESAPIPVLVAPVLPPSISCENALSFTAADATYTNGLNGVCNISGNISAAIVTNFDACGGTITVTYSGNDDCGRDISIPAITVEVQPAPIPVITLPTLPTNLSCEAAGIYAPPVASYTNGQPGVCIISGSVSSDINYFYDACGGTLEIIYSGLDACGRNIPAMVAIINVDPAPAPTIDIPNFPTSLSCSAAQSFDAPFTPFDNGLTGACNISGLIQPTLVYNVNACDGGTMTIIYNGMDNCGNVLTANPIVVQVEPASLPTLKGPDDFPVTMYCWDAANGFNPGNAIYTNGETGLCENAGEIEPIVTEIWDACDGGIIIYDYQGTDDCGNELTPLVLKIAVLPDTWAPDGACAPYEETMTSIDEVPGPDELDYYFAQVAYGYYEACSDVLVTLVDDTGEPECSGDGHFERIYTVEISDGCGNVAGTCTITFSGFCNPNFCTMSQKFYGNPDAEINGQTSSAIIDMLLGNGTIPIMIGDGTDCGFLIDDALCVQAMLNSYGAAVSLPTGYSTDCFDTNNSLINQIVTTILNIRHNQMLNPVGSLEYGELTLGAACLNVPGFILAEMPNNPTVNDLLNYANNYLACQCNDNCGSFIDNNHPIGCLTNLFWGLNSRFDNCQVPGPCGSNISDPNDIGISAPPVLTNDNLELYPNPTKEIINLKIKGLIGLPATIEIFDTRGAKLGEKSYQAIEQNILEFDVHNFEPGLYWISLNVEGHDQITKRFMVVK